MEPSDKISKYFTYKEALWLPQENRMAEIGSEVDDTSLENLKILFSKMDLIREFLDKPIIVHITFRTMEYHKKLYEQINAKKKAQGLPEVKVPMGSPHLYGQACDFHANGLTCDEVVKLLLDNNKLEEWQLRMEDNGVGANWVHIDIKSVGASGNRFFKP